MGKWPLAPSPDAYGPIATYIVLWESVSPHLAVFSSVSPHMHVYASVIIYSCGRFDQMHRWWPCCGNLQSRDRECTCIALKEEAPQAYACTVLCRPIHQQSHEDNHMSSISLVRYTVYRKDQCRYKKDKYTCLRAWEDLGFYFWFNPLRNKSIPVIKAK